jgi:hypothetical protein
MSTNLITGKQNAEKILHGHYRFHLPFTFTRMEVIGRWFSAMASDSPQMASELAGARCVARTVTTEISVGQLFPDYQSKKETKGDET